MTAPSIAGGFLRPQLNLIEVATFPRLAWLAEFDRSGSTIEVRHGSGVETRDSWLVEGVWDGAFEEGGFETSAAFFGSGLKVEDDGVLLVPSSATVDRIMYCEDGARVIASNSLVLLMARTGASLDPAHNYRVEAFASTRGFKRYESSFHIVHPTIRAFHQVYYAPVQLKSVGSETRDRVEPAPFTDYSSYVSHLRRTIAALGINATSAARRAPVAVYSTISAGYDSTAVTLLGREIGITASYTSQRSNSTISPLLSRQAAIDDGTPIGNLLGVTVRPLDQRPVPSEEHELLFLAASAADPELIFHSMAVELEQAGGVAMLLTGYQGGKVWAMSLPADFISDEIQRSDASGLNLSEVRLRAGFFHVAVPFIGARHLRDLLRISNSEEMRPWRLGTDYDRTIPRRILEDGGIPRAMFGHRKRAVIQYYDFPRNDVLRRRFVAYLRSARGMSGASARSLWFLDKATFPFFRVIEKLFSASGRPLKNQPLRPFRKALDLPHELHVWAMKELSERVRVQHGFGGPPPR